MTQILLHPVDKHLYNPGGWVPPTQRYVPAKQKPAAKRRPRCPECGGLLAQVPCLLCAARQMALRQATLGQAAPPR